MVSTAQPMPLTQNDADAVTEYDLVRYLTQLVSEAGVDTEPIHITNLYVSLKSKPLAILAGPEHTGKSAAAESIAIALTGGDSVRFQKISGHAWWAAKSGNVALFTQAQTRFTVEKISALIEEAVQYQNAGRVFMVCLPRISPAELTRFFSEVAVQRQHGPISLWPTIKLPQRIPLPSNVFLVATIDTTHQNWLDTPIHSSTTLIQWQESKVASPSSYTQVSSISDIGRVFLYSRICNFDHARRKLESILGDSWQAIPSLVPARMLCDDLGGLLPHSVIGEMLIYLANAWSRENIGLFNTSISRNLAIAGDHAIAQYILPCILDVVRTSIALRKQLRKALVEFPQSAVLLERLGRNT